MRSVLPLLLKDGYKVGHLFQYPPDTTEVYSNFTPRNTRREVSGDGIVFFGLQYFVQEYLIDQFNTNFFQRPRDEVVAEYARRINNYLGPDAITYDHVGALHDLGYLPLRVKAVPEGTIVPYGVPALTVVNTKPEFFWLTNMIETLMSSVLWKASTSATTARQFRQVFEEFATLTGAPREFIPWQGHDFSFRGMCGVEDASVSGAAHLLYFTGTDTIPAIDFLENYYGANSDNELVGGSVAATEHSVMSMGTIDGEFETFKRLITEIYPTGIVSIVSDTWDLWKVLTDYMPRLRDEVMARGEGSKVVIRPDTGDPVKILCGDPDEPVGSPAYRGVVEILADTFGGTKNAAGYIELDPHVGAIYGDSINLDRQRRILSGLAAKGYASSNIVMGLGSFTYQYVTRDTDGWAMKATSGVTTSHGRMAIWKDPKTGDGSKKSAVGLLSVVQEDGKLSLWQNVTEDQEREGILEIVFENGTMTRFETLAEIRARVESAL